jgi:hypothetical protein
MMVIKRGRKNSLEVLKNMKVKCDGMDLEGNPSEIAEFVKAYKVVGCIDVEEKFNAVNSSVKKARKIKRQKCMKGFNAVQTAKIIELWNKGESLAVCLEKSIGRTSGSLYSKGKKLLRKNGLHYYKRRTKKIVYSKIDRRIERGKAISKRAGELMKTLNLPRDNAMRLACEEWDKAQKA